MDIILGYLPALPYMSSPLKLCAKDKMFGSSSVPSIIECDANICSIRVEPALGKPRIKIGSFVLHPPSPRFLKKSSLHTSI